ncbi:MAG TPA: hypothetical protein VKT52_02715, partial [Ktedonobacterales bacterium]|nr:hypothetical protein [Ktedonobacterales bacterium]
GAPSRGNPRLGLGLEGMRERTRLLGGRFTVRSTPGAGCIVRVSVPAPATRTTAANSETHEVEALEAFT